MRQDFGLQQKILQWMYAMIVRPIIKYEAVVWFDDANQENTKEMVD